MSDYPANSVTPTGAGENARWVRDAVERLARAFVAAFIGVYAAGGVFDVHSLADASVLQKAGAAGIAAVMSIIMSFLAKWSGRKDSAGFTV